MTAVIVIVAAERAVAAGDARALPPLIRPGGLTATVGRHVLSNGVRVVTERMPEARSASIGFWIGVGGRDEPEAIAGASHFLEHLVFKGTEERSARDIAEAVDAVGGEMNAFTSREHTAYYARLPASQLRLGLDLLTDVLSRPAVRPSELDAEREVILEELSLSEDEPDDKVHSLLADSLFPDHPLGREVLGEHQTVSAMTREEIVGFFADLYRPANIVVAVAGAIDPEEIVLALDGYLAGADRGQPPRRDAPNPGVVSEVSASRPTEQAHIAIGWRGLAEDDPDRFALAILNQVLGGGMASRLFQEIREERGLAYNVFSSTSLYSDSGALVAYAGTAPSKLDEVRAIITTEVTKLLEGGITNRELSVAAGYLEGSLLLSLEDSGSRMARLGRVELSAAPLLGVEEQIELIREVTVADVARVIERVLGSPSAVATVGPSGAGGGAGAGRGAAQRS